MNKLTSLILGGALGAAAIAGTTSPVVLDMVLARSPQVAEDLSGPCDELEHAGDPRCATINLPASGGPSSTVPPMTVPSSTVPAPGGPSSTVPSTTVPSSTVPAPGGPSSTVPSMTVPSSTVPAPGVPSPNPGDGSTLHRVSDAGTVSIVESGGLVTVVGVQPADGWEFTIQQNGTREAEVNFRRGSERVDFKAEFEDGAVRIRVRDRRAADGSSTTTPTTVTGPVATVPSTTTPTTPTTIDDRGRHGDDDDRGRGRHGDDDDRGRGRHGDDDDRGRGRHGGRG